MVVDSWYPRHEHYWFDDATAAQQPLRMGDLVTGLVVDGGDWLAALVTHPTCEIPKNRTKQVQVVRVRSLDEVKDATQQERIILGFETKDGTPRPAFAQTFYVAPVPGASELFGGAMFADFNEVARVDTGRLERAAAMTHECRLHFMRRKLYYRYRWLAEVELVREWEAHRIGSDPTFTDPRPEWAPLLG